MNSKLFTLENIMKIKNDLNELFSRNDITLNSSFLINKNRVSFLQDYYFNSNIKETYYYDKNLMFLDHGTYIYILKEDVNSNRKDFIHIEGLYDSLKGYIDLHSEYLKFSSRKLDWISIKNFSEDYIMEVSSIKNTIDGEYDKLILLLTDTKTNEKVHYKVDIDNPFDEFLVINNFAIIEGDVFLFKENNEYLKYLLKYDK